MEYAKGSGKVKFEARAGFYDEWGDVPALEYKTKNEFYKGSKTKKAYSLSPED
ncbi:MAG: hypothetical protein ACLTJ5_08865 [Clostridium sp.]